jgi:hypothetical protein
MSHEHSPGPGAEKTCRGVVSYGPPQFNLQHSDVTGEYVVP